MSSKRPLCVVIAALGGQGGGVLLDWLVEAARHEGFPAQATSIAGVAQRTGATTYYLELFPNRQPEKDPVFSLFPSAGEVDLFAALEPTEAARAIELGFIGTDTTALSVRERIYSTAEKTLPGDGRLPAEPVLEALRRAAKRTVIFDGKALGGETGRQLNAAMFGAIAGTGVLPLSEDACRAAIRTAGVAVEANLAGFAAGLETARAPAGKTPGSVAGDPAPNLEYDAAPAALAARVNKLPAPVRAMAGHGAARLLDYQDDRYAGLYLDRLEKIIALETGDKKYPVSVAVARRLAAWMSFEDVIRVGQLKTRPGRLARIRAELGAPQDAPLIVRDFLKPGREELEGLLPPVLARLMPKPKPGVPRKGLKLRVRTSSPLGWLTLRAMAKLKPWRRRTARFAREQGQIKDWLAAVMAAVPDAPALALDTANLAVWARGYGDTRARGLGCLGNVSGDFEEQLAADGAALEANVGAALSAAYDDPDGEQDHDQGGPADR
jgi:indolepyruvate ferredoxin oxidoreductase beta subunit